jgi:hypothetical protein
MRNLTWFPLCFLSLLTSAVEAAPKVTEPVVREIAKVGDTSVVMGFLSSKEEQTFLGMVLLWFAREAWSFLREKANKTGEKIASIDTKLTSLENTMSMFIRAYEKEEQRINERLRRVEDKRL